MISTNPDTDSSQNVVHWPERWVKKRYGLALFLSLLLWPVLGMIPQLESLVVNGLLLDSYWQLAYLTITNVVAFFFSISILRVLESRNSGGRMARTLFGNGENPWGWMRVLSVASIATLAPLFIALRFRSEFAGNLRCHVFYSVGTILGSVLVGIGGLWCIGWIKSLIFGSHEESANYFPFESRSMKGNAWVRNISLKVEKLLAPAGLGNTDVQFLVYLLLLAMVHHQIARNFEDSKYWLTSAPSMLVLFLWLIFMVLAGLANWLDRWRIPPLLVFGLMLTILMTIRGSTRLLKTFEDQSNNQFVQLVSDVRKNENKLLDCGKDITQRRQLIADETSSLEQAAWSAITKRMGRLSKYENSKGKTLVVVTCPGGGIHAAAWAACVLDKLSDEYVEFKDSVCIISGVSGGSVGTLMFVGSRYEDDLRQRMEVSAPNPSTEEVHDELKAKSPALELSTRSALEAIAFGATVDDLYNLAGIPGPGRGQRLEDDLNARLPPHVQEMTMGQWGDRSLAGAVPIVIFNSTDAVTGRRILFDTIPTPRRASNVGLIARPLNYRELLDTHPKPVDLLPATAARTSATFPYVSPFTKPSRASDIGQHVAVCDGGYVDNEGIVTAVNWIEFLLKKWAPENQSPRTFDRILLLRIEPSWVEDKNQPAASGGFLGALRWLAGPGEAMANVRSASQLERGNLEADLAALFLKVKPKSDSSADKTQPLQLNLKTNTERAQRQAEGMVEVEGFDKRKYSESQIRQNWEEMLDKFETTLEGTAPPSPSIAPRATVVESDDENSDEKPVIIEIVRFVDASQSIPLNWKLSNRQKRGYLLAWDLCAKEGSSLRQTLDRYFNRAENINE